MLCQTKWPSYDESKTIKDSVTVAVQINGSMENFVQQLPRRGIATIRIQKNEHCLTPKAAQALKGKTLVKVIGIKKQDRECCREMATSVFLRSQPVFLSQFVNCLGTLLTNVLSSCIILLLYKVMS